MKFITIIIFIVSFITAAEAKQKDRAYFAGGCFWCMEEAFEKLSGVEDVISGYSGGTTENPTYREVTYGKTGHFEVVEIVYDKEIISFKELLNTFWKNIDPFDPYGQFCDKGYSYRSVAFYQNNKEKKLIENSVKELEKEFNKKIVTYIRSFEKFYKAEVYHQDFYVKKFQRYLEYKTACRREEILNNIWNL
jgi:peptide-methionine (S)-S-oxide reductase